MGRGKDPFVLKLLLQLGVSPEKLIKKGYADGTVYKYSSDSARKKIAEEIEEGVL